MSTNFNFLQELSSLLAIPSEMGKAEKNAPFGKECRRALDHFLDLGSRMGFSTYNADGYAGHIEFASFPSGTSKENIENSLIVGVLVHLDVVPAGDGWATPPYEATVVDGKLYARGAMDDKGPAVISLFALKELREELEASGEHLNARIRIIAGTNEENGSLCIAHYKTLVKMPDIAFSPDSDFPLINCEKNLLGYRITLKAGESFRQIVDSISGGKAHNAVPDYAECLLKEGVQELASLEGIEGVCVKKDANKIRVISHGVSAHSMEAEKGDNAVLKMLRAFKGARIGLEGSKELAWLICHLDDNATGEGLDIAFSDDISGGIKVNLVEIKNTDSEVSVLLDMRVPVTVTPQQIEERIRGKLYEGASVVREYYTPHLFVPSDGFLVTTLLDIYRTATGDESAQPLVTGGGTYARTMQNCVAFGATFPNKTHNIHSKDEYINLNDIKLIKDMYKTALRRLAEYKE